MAKKVLNVFKKLSKIYVNSMVEYYKPIVNAKINPLI